MIWRKEGASKIKDIKGQKFEMRGKMSKLGVKSYEASFQRIEVQKQQSNVNISCYSGPVACKQYLHWKYPGENKKDTAQRIVNIYA